jgi:hypothetical protein
MLPLCGKARQRPIRQHNVAVRLLLVTRDPTPAYLIRVSESLVGKCTCGRYIVIVAASMLSKGAPVFECGGEVPGTASYRYPDRSVPVVLKGATPISLPWHQAWASRSTRMAVCRGLLTWVVQTLRLPGSLARRAELPGSVRPKLRWRPELWPA